MGRFFDLSSWIVLFALLPFSVLAFLSQGAVPGDLFYPVKRGLENVVLTASAFHPSTQVAFRTNLTERRFQEAEQLLLSQGQTVALTDFVGHVQTVEEEIIKLSSSEDREKASENLIAKIEEYETKLAVVQAQVEQQPVSQPTPVSEIPQLQQPTPTPTAQTPAPGQTATPTPPQQVKTPTPTPTQTSAPVITTPAPTQKPIIQIPFQPTPTPAQVVISDPVKKEEVVHKVEETKKRLEEIKERVKKEKEDAEVEIKIREEAEEQRKNLERGRSNSADEDND